MVIFHNFKAHALAIQKLLRIEGLRTVLLNAEQSQQERQIAFEKMRMLKIRCVIATDLIARGVDLPDVQIVINLDVPAMQEELIHRIGRAGRFGASGLALNFVSKDQLKTNFLRHFDTISIDDAILKISTQLKFQDQPRIQKRLNKEKILIENRKQLDSNLQFYETAHKRLKL